jgi:putative transposase
MKGSRFNEEQIIGVLREHEAGAKPDELCRRHGISSATLYKWKAKYGGLEVSARRLKALEDENRRLKKLLAESCVQADGMGSIIDANQRRRPDDTMLRQRLCELAAQRRRVAIGGSAGCSRARAACSTTRSCTGSIVKSNSCYGAAADANAHGEHECR